MLIKSSWLNSGLELALLTGRLTVVCEVVKEEGGKIKEWIEEDKMGQIGDASNKL